MFTRESVLVVVEGHAACPYWMDHWGTEPAADWSMVEQEEWESAEAFRERLEVVLDRERLAGAAATIVLVSSAATDAPAMASRWELANGVMNHLLRSGGGALVVTRGFGHRGQAQPALE